MFTLCVTVLLGLPAGGYRYECPLWSSAVLTPGKRGYLSELLHRRSSRWGFHITSLPLPTDGASRSWIAPTSPSCNRTNNGNRNARLQWFDPVVYCYIWTESAAVWPCPGMMQELSNRMSTMHWPSVCLGAESRLLLHAGGVKKRNRVYTVVSLSSPLWIFN